MPTLKTLSFIFKIAITLGQNLFKNYRGNWAKDHSILLSINKLKFVAVLLQL